MKKVNRSESNSTVAAAILFSVFVLAAVIVCVNLIQDPAVDPAIRVTAGLVLVVLVIVLVGSSLK
jgi:hypothetical protein